MAQENGHNDIVELLKSETDSDTELSYNGDEKDIEVKPQRTETSGLRLPWRKSKLVCIYIM